jgi:hypothetical protein
MPRRKYDITPERFIQVWQTSKNASEAAELLGMPKAIMFARASAYREQGIKLKKMPRKSRRLDIERLNGLIEKLASEKETE